MAKRKMKKNARSFLFFLLLVCCILGVLYYYVKNKDNSTTIELPVINYKVIEEEKKKKEEAYNTCLNETYTEEELTEDITTKIMEIDSFIVDNNYKTSVYYEDIITGFSYKYQADTIYYGCSLIKLVDALYLIDKATLGEIDLDKETIVYESKYKRAYSSGMATRSIGERVTLRDLITYAISVSDNSAHLMLLDYIGFENLKQYGKELGAKVILTGGDKFGNQTAEDTNIYLKKAYQIISENKLYGDFLKTIMDNNERNAFNTETIKIYHKYGSYDINYHNIGLSLEERPYAISIFTLHEKTNYTEVVQGIHGKIRELHNLFYENRQRACRIQVYGE